MGMNQPNLPPEVMQQLMQQGAPPPQGDPSQDPSMQQDDPANGQPQDPQLAQSQQPMTGGAPNAGMFSPPEINDNAVPSVDPMDMLNDVIAAYMGYATEIVNDNTLDKPIQSKILLEQAQAISSLVSLIHSDPSHPANAQGQDPEVLQAEMAMKQQQHEQDMNMKSAVHDQEMQMQTERHQMDMAKMQHDMQMAQMKLEHEHHMAKQKIQHNEEDHQQKVVHAEKDQKLKEKQAKQAPQSKAGSKQGK